MSLVLASSSAIPAPKSTTPEKFVEFPQIKVATSSYNGGKPGTTEA
jgi:hypothetical protein